MTNPSATLFRSVRAANWRGAMAGLGVVGLLAVGGCGDEAPPVAKLTAAQVQEQLAEPVAGQPPAARKLEEQAGEVLRGGSDPAKLVETKVGELKGTPVVVNVWADWCQPCKKEMPIFQRVALDQRGKVAFFAVASQAPEAKTVAYLREQIALPYPSVIDEDGKVIEGTGVDGLPKTFFYDRTGKRFVHNGPYETEAALLADIARYAS
ncbi:MAG: redoxin domain-containing protein [Solirubrobacteraceae bacterium]|nr:redoxin domain-containing protein [Solirubrobacteraceae bacterium]